MSPVTRLEIPNELAVWKKIRWKFFRASGCALDYPFTNQSVSVMLSLSAACGFSAIMRLWSIHPKYLDAKGLVALWREALLAQKVLLGSTVGYKNHPQLERFRNTGNQQGAIATYLRHVADEADVRGYQFNRDKIVRRRLQRKIPVTNQQVAYERSHLLKKLSQREPVVYEKFRKEKSLAVHPLFTKVPGKIESWEKY